MFHSSDVIEIFKIVYANLSLDMHDIFSNKLYTPRHLKIHKRRGLG